MGHTHRSVHFVPLVAIIAVAIAVSSLAGDTGTPSPIGPPAPAAPDPCVRVEAGVTVRPAEQNLDLRFIPVVPETQQRFDSKDWEEGLAEPTPHKPAASSYVAPQAAPVGPSAPMPGPSIAFPGMGFSDTCTGGQCGAGWPPDTNGDVGPNHYVQAVNTAFAVYDKSGTKLASTTFNSLWSGAATGTPCDNKHDGDPVVVYDPMGDRWFVTDFAFAISGGKPVAPCYECIAVSKTPDPVSGGWYLYAVNQSNPPGGSGLLNDYPKFGIWTDGLYQSANMFNLPSTSYWGTAFWAYSRLDLEAGNPVTPIVASISGTSTFTLLPANLRIGPQGAFPPTGTPEYLLGDSQSAYAFEVRKFTVNWGTATGTLSSGTNVAYAAANNPRSPSQSGTSQTLDSLQWRGMVQAQYKKVGSAESLWINHTVSSSASANNGPQWSQIDVSGGTIVTTPVQTQIYQPDTTLDRWMASLAVDGIGNMAIGYSTSNSSSFPSLAYSGRLVGDALNALPQTETSLFAGTGSQTTYSRWGDYSGMSIDPTDDCTFWYTNEYYASTGTNWQTRVGAFKFPSCTLTSGTLVATVTDCSGAAVKNAVVNIDGHDYGVTPASGVFNAYLGPGSHSVYASYSGNTSATKTASITAGVTTNLSLAVGPLPAAPAAPSFTAVAQTSLTVNWAAVGGATTYDVWRASGGTCSGAAKITSSPVAGTSYGDSGLTCGTQYSYYVVANNGCGASTNGSCASQTTAVCVTPPLRVPYTVNPTKITTTTQGASGTVTWDTSNCASTNYHIIYGKGENLASWTIDGGKCSMGTSGSYSWTSIPDPSAYTSRFLWFLVVGDNGGTTEGSWGLTSGAAERGGTNASGQCSCTTKDTSGSCGTS